MEMMEIGYISRPHGIKGEVFLRLYSGEANWSEQPESFKLKMKTGSQLSAKSEKMRSHKNGLIIKFDQITDRTEAETFTSTKVFADKKFYSSEEGENPYFHELIGLKIFDIDEQLLGKIDGMLSTGHQDIMSIKTPDGETFLAPYVDAFIVEDKRQDGELIVNFPEGLQHLP